MFNHLLSSMKLLIATADVKTCMLALLKIPTGPICFLLISDALCAVVASFLPPCSCVFVRVNFVFLSFAGCGRFARPLTFCFYPGACGGTASVPLPMSTHLSSKRRKCSLACSGHHSRTWSSVPHWSRWPLTPRMRHLNTVCARPSVLRLHVRETR